MNIETKCKIGGAVVVLVFLGLWLAFPHLTRKTVTFVVKDKERIVNTTGDSVESRYLVFTDIEVFQNTDSIAMWKFNSSDVQGDIDPGCEYEAIVYGWRIPFMSSYRNIVSVKRMVWDAENKTKGE